MTTANENLNPFKKNDRVIINDASFFLGGLKGRVLHVFDISTEIRLDSGMTVIIAFTKLTKLEEIENGSKNDSRTSKKRTKRRTVPKSSRTKKSRIKK